MKIFTLSLSLLILTQTYCSRVPSSLLIHDALLNGYPIELMDRIIEKNNLDINEPDQYGRNILVVATAFNRAESIVYFYTKGININWQDNTGRTALHWAASWGRNESVSVLLELGANPLVKNALGQTAYDLAVEKGHVQASNILQKHVNDVSYSSVTPCSATMYNDQLEIVMQQNNLPELKKMVSRENVNTCSKSVFQSLNETNATPLLLASAAHNYDISQYLLELGANPNTRSQFGRTPLHEFIISCYRAQNIDLRFIALFATYKTDMNAKDCLGMTPFQIAACTGRCELLQELLKFGANPHETSYSGSTALHYATAKDNLKAVKFLVEEVNLKIDEMDISGISPFATALTNKYLDISAYFAKRIGNTAQDK